MGMSTGMSTAARGCRRPHTERWRGSSVGVLLELPRLSAKGAVVAFLLLALQPLVDTGQVERVVALAPDDGAVIARVLDLGWGCGKGGWGTGGGEERREEGRGEGTGVKEAQGTIHICLMEKQYQYRYIP